MNILAVDTSGTGCSVALYSFGCLLAELNLRKNETHSKHLMSVISSIIQVSGTDISGIDAFAVTKGPGSFTGLRIGMSTIKGLALSMGKNVVGVSSLDALAYGAAVTGHKSICAMIDARKDEVFNANYTCENGVPVKMSDEELKGLSHLGEGVLKETLFVGSGAYRYRELIMKKAGELAFFADDFFNHIRAAVVALLGEKELKQSPLHSVSDVAASYIRKSDAEIHRDFKADKTAMV